MTRSRTIAIAGLTAGLLAGGGVGMTLGLPSIAGAQTVATTETTVAVDPARPATGERLEHGAHGWKHGKARGMKGAPLDVVAPLLGSTVEDVAAALRSGTSIAAQAEAAGVPLATIVDALVAELSEKLTEAVEAGRLTQEQADEKLAEAPQRITTMLDKVPPAGGMRDGGGMGRHRGGRF